MTVHLDATEVILAMNKTADVKTGRRKVSNSCASLTSDGRHVV